MSPGSPLRLPPHPGQLVSNVFDAFAWRAPPWRSGSRACWRSCSRELSSTATADAPNACLLADIPPRDLTLDFVEAHFAYPNPLTCLRKEAFLYFFPAFMSFWIKDPTNDNALLDCLTWRFRYFPFYGHVDRWRSKIFDGARSEEGERFNDDRFSAWFLTGDDWHCTADLVLSMTLAEREVAAASFDFLGRAAPLYFELMELESVSALLRGRPTAEVLGSCREEDKALLLDALDALRARVPAVADDLAAVERAIREGTSIDVLAESVRHRDEARLWRMTP